MKPITSVTNTIVIEDNEVPDDVQNNNSEGDTGIPDD